MAVPDYYQPIMPYLVVKDADEFIAFIKAVFNAEENLIVRTPDDLDPMMPAVVTAFLRHIWSCE